MYLTKKTKINQYAKQGQEINPSQKEWNGIKLERIEEITEEMGYWRKANAIHKWMVKNIQGGNDDCKEYEITREQMEDLKKRCEIVLKNKKIANKILPTESGFFFGEIEYDEYYYQYIENTKEILEKCISERTKGLNAYYYQSSW